MCKIISSDAVICNFILEAVERNKFDISIEQMIDYDDKLSENLREYDYFTKFDFDGILNFSESYPFLVKYIEPNCIKIFNESDDTTGLANQLKRYFRMGMPRLVIQEMVSASKSIFSLE